MSVAKESDSRHYPLRGHRSRDYIEGITPSCCIIDKLASSELQCSLTLPVVLKRTKSTDPADLLDSIIFEFYGIRP